MIDSLNALATTPTVAPGIAVPAGATGASAYQIAVANGFVGSEVEWAQTLAYQAAVAAGFSGTLSQWLASLVGPQGPAGPGTTGTRRAAQIIYASTVVVDNGDGSCSIANPNDPSHRGRVLGLVTVTTAAGQLALYQNLGAVAGVGGTFAAGDRLFIGDGFTGRVGSLVAARPSLTTAAWFQTVGTAASAASANLLLGEPVGITRGPVQIALPQSLTPSSDVQKLLSASTLADVRALLFSGLPTSDPGIRNALWRNGDFLSVSATV